MANKRPTLNAKFGPLTLSYPHLNTPDDKFGEDVYKADGVEDPNSPAMKKAKAILADAIKQFGLDPKDCKLPLVKETQKDPNAPEGTRKPKRVETGKLLLKAKTKRAPLLVDARAKAIDPKSVEIGGGSVAYLEGFLSPYEMKGDEGISFTLTGVQIVKLVERRGNHSFTAIDDDDAYVAGEGSDAGDDLNLGSDSDDADQDDGGVLDI
jgi:hypothetical protein